MLIYFDIFLHLINYSSTSSLRQAQGKRSKRGNQGIWGKSRSMGEIKEYGE